MIINYFKFISLELIKKRGHADSNRGPGVPNAR